MLLFALFYAIIFWIVASKRPYYAFVVVWALTPFQFDVGTGDLKFSLTEINLLLLVPLLMVRLHSQRRSFGLGPMSWPIGAYLLVSLVSVVSHWRGSAAVVSMMQMVLYMVITVQIFATLLSAEELRRVPSSLIATGALWSIIGIVAHFDVFDLHKNAFGASLAAAALVAFDSWLCEPKGVRRNWIVAGGFIILAGLTMSLSRGSWLGAVGGLVVIVMLRRASRVLMRVCLVAMPLLFVLWNSLSTRQQNYAFNFDSSRGNIRARYVSVQKAHEGFAEDPILGVGVGLRKQYDATNLLWMTLAETGILGALTFTWIFVAFYRLTWRARAMLDTKDPCFSLITIGASLMTCKMLHGMVDHYWARGSLTLAWGGVGMVLVASRLPALRASQATRALAAQKRAAPLSVLRPLPIHAYAPLGEMEAVPASVWSWDEGENSTNNFSNENYSA